MTAPDLIEVPILIVGAGPSGLSASILLSRLGIPSLTVERHPGTSIYPSRDRDQHPDDGDLSISWPGAASAACVIPAATSRPGQHRPLGQPPGGRRHGYFEDPTRFRPRLSSASTVPAGEAQLAQAAEPLTARGFAVEVLRYWQRTVLTRPVARSATDAVIPVRPTWEVEPVRPEHQLPLGVRRCLVEEDGLQLGLRARGPLRRADVKPLRRHRPAAQLGTDQDR